MVVELPDPEWYLDNVLVHAERGRSASTPVGAAAEWRRWWQSRVTDSEPVLVASRQGFVLAPADVLRLGLTRARMRTMVEHGTWTTAGRGLVSPVDVRETDTDQSAKLLVARRSHVLRCSGSAYRRRNDVVTARSAAIVHGLPTMFVPTAPELTAAGDFGHGHRRTAHIFSAEMPNDETCRWYGVAVESVARTLVSLARHGRRDAIMAADAALREGLVTTTEIRSALETARGWPWVRQARTVLALADARSESPLESITRLALHEDGFPPPEPQVWIGPDRVDFYWAKYKYVLEADGRGKYTGDALWKEKKREARLRRNGAEHIERVIWPDVIDDWPATRARLWRPIQTASSPVW